MNNDYSKLNHMTLLGMRHGASPERQRELAPYEHRAFAREMTEENPLNALGLLWGIPAYQVAKLLGLHSSRTGFDPRQAGHGLLGVGEGLYSGLLGKR